MYRPTEPGESVETPFGPGVWTGETSEDGESFEIQYDGESEKDTTLSFHYEDLRDSDRIERVPLDPDEGPTAWLEIEETDTAEKAKVFLISGIDPWDPHKRIILNRSEALKAAWFIKDRLSEPHNP